MSAEPQTEMKPLEIVQEARYTARRIGPTAETVQDAFRSAVETSAADMANAGARKELEGFSDAFPERDRLKAMEAEAAQRRSGETETGWSCTQCGAAKNGGARCRGCGAGKPADETSEGHPTNEVDTRIDVLEDALTRILNWAEAYPLDVFPEPDFQAVQAALQNAGISLAQVSASNMR